MTTRSGTQLEPSSTHAAFAEMICQDDELLQAEFAAIVAAGWSCLPPRGAVTVTSRVEPPGPAGAVGPGPTVSGARPPYVGASRSRQRSPPALPTVTLKLFGRPRPSTAAGVILRPRHRHGQPVRPARRARGGA
jgi:hypothetical protein